MSLDFWLRALEYTSTLFYTISVGARGMGVRAAYRHWCYILENNINGGIRLMAGDDLRSQVVDLIDMIGFFIANTTLILLPLPELMDIRVWMLFLLGFDVSRAVMLLWDTLLGRQIWRKLVTYLLRSP